MLYLGLIPGDYVGWGICSRYLIRELAELVPIRVMDFDAAAAVRHESLDGKVFCAIGDHHLTKVMDVAGTENFGYTFFENRLADGALENARSFDRVFAGSSWCRDQLLDRGVSWSDILIQGIDPDLFFPVSNEKPGARDYFVIYSGGKFELRKGQDLVIKAVRVMQERHDDVLLVACWHNAWQFSMNTMVHSPWIPYKPQENWRLDTIRDIMFEVGIDLERTEILPKIPQDQLRKIYACTDVGLFPNRCEGGTNLVLMEYMACGKPAIASYTSGHRDILTDENSLRLRQLTPFELRVDGSLEAVWEEPALEEIVEALEYAYRHSDAMRALGKKAGEDLKKKTWTHTAVDLVGKLGL